VVKEVEKKEQSKGKELLNEKIKEDRSTRKMDHGKLSKWKKPSMECFGAPHGNDGKTGWQSPENMGQVDLGF
jgi:hypothetical protein